MNDQNKLLNKPEIQPSVFRFYLGALSVGMMMGITWTAGVLRWVHSPYSYQALYGFAGLLFVWQLIYLYQEWKRLNAMKAEINANWEILKEKYPEMPWDEVKPR